MAYTEFGTGSAQTIKRWSDMLFRESFGKMGITALIGKGAGACIQLLTDLDKGAGDQIKYDLLVQDRSPGVNGDNKLKGFETALTYYQDSILVNQKRHAHAFKGMSQQRTLHDLRRDARYSLSEWWSWFMEGSIMAHLAGVSGTGSESVVGALGADTGGSDFAGNGVTAIDANHLEDTGAAFALSDIDTLVTMAKTMNPRIAPLKVEGQDRFILYMHPYSVHAMRTTVSASDLTWQSVHQNADVRGSSNPIYTGALGVYNGVIIRESEFVPYSGGEAHNIFLGQGAGAIAFGNAWGKQGAGGSGNSARSPFNWREEEEDYGNERGVAGISCLGLKGTIFNSEAFGRIVLRTTDAAP